MINHEVVISIINASLSGVPVALDEDFSIEEYIRFARTQQIEALLITGLRRSGIILSPEIRKVLYGAAMISTRQLYALSRLCDRFTEHGIDHMPIKGSVLKSIYPSNEMRSMGDIDILVRMDQYAHIRPLMLEEGYEEDHESDHEYVWTGKGVHVELHKLLFQPSNKDYYDYFGECWQFARPTDVPYRFEMSLEDTFIYLFTHYAKHYRNTGVGIRQALDLYIYRRTYPGIDEAYVVNKMQILQMERFYHNTMHMLDVWFGDGEHTEASQLIENRLFDSGVFGTQENNLQSVMLRQVKRHGTVKKAKLITWLRWIFPTYRSMCERFPILDRFPVLTPFLWIVRCMDVLIHKRYRFHDWAQETSATSENSINAYHDMLRKSGLDFNFKGE